MISRNYSGIYMSTAKTANHVLVFKRKFWESNKHEKMENKINEIQSKGVNWNGLRESDNRGADLLRLPVA